jgi:hypothetical protein
VKPFINIIIFTLLLPIFCAANNPFLRPGSNSAKPPVVQKPAPPPPKPIPRNPNIEFRGYYEFQGEWKIALFDKAKNQGVWLSKGEKIADFDAEVESFNPESEVIRLRGGMSLSLKDSDKTVLPVPSGRATPPASAKKPPSKPNVQPRTPAIPLPRRR